MKPFLSYIGSKQKFMDKLDQLFPESINNYYESFVGGGSVLFYLNNLEDYNIKHNYINDVDSDVINIYKVIKNDTKKLLRYLEELNKLHSKKDFNNLIDTFNYNKKDKVMLAAIYIFLNKRSFNGNCKYNSDNLLNCSYSNSKKNSNIYSIENIEDIANILKTTIIKNKDYIKFLNEHKPKSGDFVLFDPPYLVNNINQYYKESFDIHDFEKLKQVCDKLDSKKVNFMITLNKHPKLKKLFQDYNIKTFTKKSSFTSCKYNEYEMIITNY